MAFSEEQTDPPPASSPDPEVPKWWERAYEVWSEKSEVGVIDPITGWHYYWKNGLRLDSPDKNFTIRIFGSIYVDGGYISADDDLESAFPDLDGVSHNLGRYQRPRFTPQ